METSEVVSTPNMKAQADENLIVDTEVETENVTNFSLVKEELQDQDLPDTTTEYMDVSDLNEPNPELGQESSATQADPLESTNIECDNASYDPFSSIVIANVETVAEDVETPETQVSLPDQQSVSPKKYTFHCDQCEFSATTRFSLARHQTVHQNEPFSSTNGGDASETSKVFKCKYCSFQSKIRSALQKHSLRHAKQNALGNQFLCQHCGYAGISKKSLVAHLINSHKNFTKRCEDCHKLVPSQFKKLHHSTCVPKSKYVKPALRSVYKCNKCSFSTKNKNEWSGHQNVCPAEIKEEKLKECHSADLSEKLNCIHCTFKGKSEHSLMLHTVKIHLECTQRCTKCLKVVPGHLMDDHLTKCEKESAQYKCKICTYSTKWRKLLKQHQKQHAKKESSNNEEEFEHKCPYCSFISSYRETLTRHLELHEVKKLPLVQCDQCDYKSTSRCVAFHKGRDHRAGVSSANPKKNQVYDCSSCSFSTNDRLELRKHSLVCKPTTGVLKCRHCPYKASSYKTLVFHSSRKHKSHLYKCQMCRLKIPTQLRDLHNRSRCVQNRDITLQCRFCSYSTYKKKYLDAHLQKHTMFNVAVVKCPLCDYKSTKQSVAKHRQTAHVAATGSYKCGYCTFRTSEILELRKHVRIHNPAQQPDNHNCEYCSFKTRDFKQFQEHLNTHPGNDCSLFNCPRCDFRSSIINMISHCVKRHQLEVTPEGLKQLECPAKSDEDVEKFIKTDLGGNETYKCTICSETSKYQYQIKAHVLMHDIKKEDSFPTEPIEIIHSVFGTTKDIPSSNVMFICETCDFSTHSKEVLIEHKETHANDSSTSQNVCQKCKESFSNVAALVKHQCPEDTKQYTIKTDGKLTWYKCKSCQFKSCGKSRMLRHWAKRHQDRKSETMFPCPFCPLRVGYKMELQKHIFSCHGMDEDTAKSKKKSSYKCDTCDFETDIKSQLHNHKVVHVNINEVRVYKTETYNVGMKGSKSTSLVFKKDKNDPLQ